MPIVIMNNVVSCFPLLDLPNKARMHVLRNMELMQQIGFSLCSEKAKTLIKSVNLKAQNIFMHVSRTVYLIVNVGIRPYVELKLPANEHNSWTNENYQPATENNIRIINENEETTNFKFEKLGYSIRKWIGHVMEVFNHSKIDELYLVPGYESYNSESMKETFKERGLKRLSMEQVAPNQAFYEVLATFPLTKQVSLSGGMSLHPESIQRLLNQNFDSLSLADASRVVLNDLLIINSSEIHVYHSLLTEIELNKFLKLWINGSNPRLRYLHSYYFTKLDKKNIDEKKLLDGIKHQIVSNENVRVFEETDRCSDTPSIRKVNSGFDIKRKDGTDATIRTNNNDNGYSFEMIVWN